MTDEDDILLSECGTCTQPFKTQLHRQEEFSQFLLSVSFQFRWHSSRNKF